jgi:large subunit ribosomal protein L29
MNVHDLRQLEIADLHAKIDALREDLFKVRFRHQTAQLADSTEIRKTRRTLARAMTILTERQREAVAVSEV